MAVVLRRGSRIGASLWFEGILLEHAEYSGSHEVLLFLIYAAEYLFMDATYDSVIAGACGVSLFPVRAQAQGSLCPF